MKLVPFKKQNRDLFSGMPLFDDFLDKFFNDDIVGNAKLMAVDVMETDEEFKIMANLPGIQKKDVKISLKDNQLIIEAEHQEKVEDKKTNYIRSERYVGKYQRYISLPDNCDVENIKAKMENGVLNLEIKKKEPTPKKQITVE
ncbi:MAG: Hsp20/alpha crystallin family protein [Candidatus Cloacimonetes bacterium]|nr:Hsp20/alpha crystallin family protein [Candidatus Cloacimonadota bacterium]